MAQSTQSLQDLQKDAQMRMDKSIKALEHELAKLRAGRANPSLLEGILVSYYGNDTPLNQVASVSVESSMMLIVKPWEKKILSDIEKAIRTSDLGLNPNTSGDFIRVPLPPLSDERRRELIKKVKHEGENAKVAIRNIRRDLNASIKDLAKDKTISEDEQKQAEDQSQKLTNKFTDQVDKILAVKEKDLLEF